MVCWESRWAICFDLTFAALKSSRGTAGDGEWQRVHGQEDLFRKSVGPFIRSSRERDQGSPVARSDLHSRLRVRIAAFEIARWAVSGPVYSAPTRHTRRAYEYQTRVTLRSYMLLALGLSHGCSRVILNYEQYTSNK